MSAKETVATLLADRKRLDDQLNSLKAKVDTLSAGFESRKIPNEVNALSEQILKVQKQAAELARGKLSGPNIQKAFLHNVSDTKGTQRIKDDLLRQMRELTKDYETETARLQAMATELENGFRAINNSVAAQEKQLRDYEIVLDRRINTLLLYYQRLASELAVMNQNVGTLITNLASVKTQG